MPPPEPGAGTLSALIVDDEAPARRRLVGVLRGIAGIGRIEECDGGRAAVTLLHQQLPDLLFLDIRMPDLDGFEVLARAPVERQPAVIFVTAYDEYAARAFAVHAFDYLLKPFRDDRVVDTVHRAATFLEWIRRRAEQVPDRFDDVRIDVARREVFRGGRLVTLRPKEFALLLALLRARGRVVSRLDLLRKVWGYADEAETRTVDTHIARLRHRLEADPARPKHIVTVRQVGYRIDGIEQAIGGD
jgi:DNA-binding response OmpR family regulator